MSGTIDVEQLRVGMFIHLDLSWMQHPFPVGSFRITHAQQIDKIRGLGLKQLRWSPEKSALPEATADAAGAEESAPIVPHKPRRSPRPRRWPQSASAVRSWTHNAPRPSCARASSTRPAWPGARRRTSVLTQPEKARRDTETLTRALLDKMLVDGDMCIRLLSGNAGDNASAHAMNVAVISLLMGRVFGLRDDEMLDLGAGRADARRRQARAARAAAPCRRALRARTIWPPTAATWRRACCTASAWACRPVRCWCWRSTTNMPTAAASRCELQLDRLAIGARIVALVNRYDNLCNPPSLAHAHTPHEALSLLFAQSRSQFDASLLNSFIRMMGVYPAGSVVQLTDDRYALVVSVNSTRPLKPNVLVHDPQQPREEALHLNLMDTPDLGIRRSLKPAQLPADALDYLAPRPRVAYFFESARKRVAHEEDRAAA